MQKNPGLGQEETLAIALCDCETQQHGWMPPQVLHSNLFSSYALLSITPQLLSSVHVVCQTCRYPTNSLCIVSSELSVVCSPHSKVVRANS